MPDRYLGPLEEAATPTRMGLMNALQAEKLAGIAEGAEVNPVAQDIRNASLLATNAIAGTAYPNAYPNGITLMQANGSGWVYESAIGNVITTKTAAGAVVQRYDVVEYDEVYVRRSTGSMSWSAWFNATGVTRSEWNNFLSTHFEMRFISDWSAGTYYPNSIVRYNGKLYVANQLINSAPYNAPGVDNRWKLFYEPPDGDNFFLSRRRTVTQSIANATWTSVAFNSTLEGLATRWITSGTVYTVDATGRYIFGLDGAWAANANGARQTRFLVNGSAKGTAINMSASGSGGMAFNNTSRVTKLYAGDTIEFQVLQTSGGTLALAADCEMSIARVS